MDMDDSARRWMINTARKNLWRVHRWYQLDDLIQDGYMAWAYVTAHYPTVTNRSHMMRLFMITYHCRIADMSKKKTKQIDYAVEEGGAQNDFAQWGLTYLSDRAGLVTLPSEECPPKLVAEALRVIQHKSREELTAPYRVRLNGTRETFNDRLCRWIGVSNDTPVCDLLKKYLVEMGAPANTSVTAAFR